MKISLYSIILILLLTMASVSAFDNKISYAGVAIKNASSGSYYNGTYSITTKLYTASSGGSPFFTNTQDVSIIDGNFVLTLDYNNTNLNQTFYLEPQIETYNHTRFQYTPAAQTILANESLNANLLSGYTYQNIPVGGDVSGTVNSLTITALDLDSIAYTGTLGIENLTACSNGEILEVSGGVWSCGTDSTGTDTTCSDVACTIGPDDTISNLNVVQNNTGIWNINISCSNIQGGSDSDYCTDSGGAGNSTEQIRQAINNSGFYNIDLNSTTINTFFTATGGVAYTIDDDGSNTILDFSAIGGTNYLEIATAGSFLQLYANPGPANDDLMFTITETQGDTTQMNFYEGGTGNNRFYSSGSVRIGGGASSQCSNLTTEVDCDTSATGSDLVVQDDIWAGGNIFATEINATTDFCIVGGNCLSDAGVGSGDITAVNTNGQYLTGGSASGDVSLLVNESYLNTTRASYLSANSYLKTTSVTDEYVCTYESSTGGIVCDGATTGTTGGFVLGQGATITIPLLTLSGASSTNNGRIFYDQTDDRIGVGDGSAVDYFYSGPHTTDTNTNDNTTAIQFTSSGNTYTLNLEQSNNDNLTAQFTVGSGTGNITGGGTANYIPKFTDSGVIGDSSIVDDGDSIIFGNEAINNISVYNKSLWFYPDVGNHQGIHFWGTNQPNDYQTISWFPEQRGTNLYSQADIWLTVHKYDENSNLHQHLKLYTTNSTNNSKQRLDISYAKDFADWKMLNIGQFLTYAQEIKFQGVGEITAGPLDQGGGETFGLFYLRDDGSSILWDLSPNSTDVTDDYQIRLFRESNTNANKQFIIFKGDGTTTSTFTVNADNGDIVKLGNINQSTVSFNSNTIAVSDGAGASGTPEITLNARATLAYDGTDAVLRGASGKGVVLQTNGNNDRLSISSAGNFNFNNLNATNVDNLVLGSNTVLKDLEVVKNKNVSMQLTSATGNNGDWVSYLFKTSSNTADLYTKAGIFYEKTAGSGRGNMLFALESTDNNQNVDPDDAVLKITYDGNVQANGNINTTSTLYLNRDDTNIVSNSSGCLSLSGTTSKLHIC